MDKAGCLVHAYDPVWSEYSYTRWKPSRAMMGTVVGVRSRHGQPETAPAKQVFGYHVLFFLHLETRRVTLTGITRRPTETWMEQKRRHVYRTTATLGFVKDCKLK